MSSNERRERLLQILKKSDEPVKGSELSAELQVSRQVVVKDIALLRASGIEILATSSGYIILNPVKPELWLDPSINDFYDFDNSIDLKHTKIKNYKHMGKIQFPITQ